MAGPATSDGALGQMTGLVMSEWRWDGAGWGERGDIGQLTMVAAGKRIPPWLFKQGMSCGLISAPYSRALRSHRSASFTQQFCALF